VWPIHRAAAARRYAAAAVVTALAMSALALTSPGANAAVGTTATVRGTVPEGSAGAALSVGMGSSSVAPATTAVATSQRGGLTTSRTPQVSAASVSCAAASQISTLVTTGSLATISGNVYVGIDLSPWQVIGHTTADILSCGGIPRVGERFYVRITTTDVQGGGVAALFTRAARLPAGVYPAVDALNPLQCFAQRLSDNAIDSSVSCPNAFIGDAFLGTYWPEAFAWSTSSTYSAYQSQVPAGWSWYAYLPVVSTRPLFGLGSPRADWLWGGVRGGWAGIPGTAYAYSGNPMTVLDRLPELTYPAAPVTSVTNSSALLTAQVANFWKAGTAAMQFGTTTAYGRTTGGDTIPGNDPTFPAYTTSPLAATGLVAGTTYHWRVRFTTTTGLTYYGADQTFTTTGVRPVGLTVPGAPRLPKAVAGRAAATVSWTAPAATGGTAITGYVVTAAPGGRTCATTGARTCVVTGLTNGISYRFSVRAVNALGAGAASALTAAVMPKGAPGVVRTVKAAFPKAKVTVVTWAAPASTGGSAIVRYEVRFHRSTVAAFGAWRSTKLVRSATIAGLLKGATYYMQVRAVNALGASAPVQVSAIPTR
jgi:hypothetical protein